MSSRRPSRKAWADLSRAVCGLLTEYRAFMTLRSLISCLIAASRSDMCLASVMVTIIRLIAASLYTNATEQIQHSESV
jgi:hypothetical protein